MNHKYYHEAQRRIYTLNIILNLARNLARSLALTPVLNTSYCLQGRIQKLIATKPHLCHRAQGH